MRFNKDFNHLFKKHITIPFPGVNSLQLYKAVQQTRRAPHHAVVLEFRWHIETCCLWGPSKLPGPSWNLLDALLTTASSSHGGLT